MDTLNFDVDQRNKVVSLLTEKHRISPNDESLSVTAAVAGDAVTATLVLKRHDQTFEYQMQAGVQRSKYKGMSLDQALELCLDFLDWYLGEYTRSRRELLLPLDWQPHRFGDVEVVARGDARNRFLDEAADAWLRGERPDVESEWRQLKGSRNS